MGQTMRLGGLVKEGSISGPATDLTFVLTDGTNEVTVHSTVAPTSSFREGSGAVVEGQLGSDGVFEADHRNVGRQRWHPEQCVDAGAEVEDGARGLDRSEQIGRGLPDERVIGMRGRGGPERNLRLGQLGRKWPKKGGEPSS